MKDDALRFGVIFLVCLVVGNISGSYSISFSVGLSLFVVWQYFEYRKILLWLKKRRQTSGPGQPGIVYDTCREISLLKNRHSTRIQKLGSFLKRFQRATSALPDAIIVLGLKGEIEWANTKAEEYLGVEWPRDSGLRISTLIRTPELVNFLKTKKGMQDNSLRLLSPLNTNIHLEVRVSSYGDNQKLLVARDITGIHRANQMRKDFIANASHELRTPLTVISGYLESFVDDEQCPQEWLAHIRQMRSQAIRMQNLIEDLLTLSAIEAGSVNAERELVKVPDVLNSICNEASTISGEQNHQIQLKVDDGLNVYGNPSQLHSAFSNLVFNAIQYTQARGVVEVEWYSDDKGAHFKVKDNGVGIASEHISRLTERFYRIDKGRSREKGGTGLGLAIVKHVLVKHGSDLVIESTPGKGSTFSCSLPTSRIASKKPVKLLF